jgi:hypothetical protein
MPTLPTAIDPAPRRLPAPGGFDAAVAGPPERGCVILTRRLRLFAATEERSQHKGCRTVGHG